MKSWWIPVIAAVSIGEGCAGLSCKDSIRTEYANIGSQSFYSFRVDADDLHPLGSGDWAFVPGDAGDAQFTACDLGVTFPRRAVATWRTEDRQEHEHRFNIVRPDPLEVARKQGVSRRKLKWNLVFGVKDSVVEYAWTVEKLRTPKELSGPRTIYLYGGNNPELLMHPKTLFRLTAEELSRIPRYTGKGQ